jgi:NADH-quinone oxidoreductase subunit C
MEREELKNQISRILPEVAFTENKQFLETIIPAEKLHDVCVALKNQDALQLDYLFCLTAVDWPDHFMVVYHVRSTSKNVTLVLKARIDDKQNPEIDTVSDIWRTAEFHEREVFDLFGIRFKNHPDLRRLFLDDDYGYPLRKDFTDEVNMIVR